MKTSGLFCVANCIVLSLLFLTTASAADFHVADAAGLQDALDTAAANGENDIIYLAGGTYGGNFSYNTGNDDALVVTGEVGTRAEDVRLDGEASGSVLILTGSQGDASVQILALTVENGGSGGVQISSEDGSLELILTQVIIQNNSNDQMGGGIHLRTYANATVNLVISDSVIRNNQSQKRGGGIRAHAYSGNSTIDLRIVNSLIYKNQASWTGGGINLTASEVGDNNVSRAVIVNSTIASNTADKDNSGYEPGGIQIHAYDAATCTVTLDLYNTIVYHNASPGGAPGRDLYMQRDGDGKATVSAHYCDVGDVGGDLSFYYQDHVISSLPLFVAPGVEDYRLSGDSPCLDTGDNGAPGLPATDIDGNDRISRGTVDMGAFEAPPIVYVSPDGFCDDHSPCYATIGDALLWEDGRFVLRVVQGIYHEAVLLDEERQITFQAGWDASFSALSGSTRIDSISVGAGLLTIDKGTISIEN